MTNALIAIPLNRVMFSQNNVRKNLKNIDELAESIRATGLVQLPTVKGPDANDNYEIVAGNRRLAALKQVFRDDLNTPAEFILLGPADMNTKALNLLENIVREGISSFEYATALETIHHEGASFAAMSKMLSGGDSPYGTSSSTLKNLVRLRTKLHPDILAAWEADEPMATIGNLISIMAGKRSDDPEKQLRQWHTLCHGGRIDETDDGQDDESDESDETETKASKKKSSEKDTGPVRRKPTEIANMVQLLADPESFGKLSKTDKASHQAMIQALEWTLGNRKTLAGIKL